MGFGDKQCKELLEKFVFGLKDFGLQNLATAHGSSNLCQLYVLGLCQSGKLCVHPPDFSLIYLLLHTLELTFPLSISKVQIDM